MKRSSWIWPLLFLVTGCSTNGYEDRRFFQPEYGVEAHGKKTTLDRLVELDPSAFNVMVASDYLAHAPARIAVMPFTDTGDANFVVDKIPLTYRNKEDREKWAWTDAQRLRRGLQGYLARREFTVINLNGIDAVLAARGIDSEQKLTSIAPQELGKWLGADAIVYGHVTNYEAYYFGLVAAWRVGLKMKMISVRDGEVLVEASGSRFDTNLLVALTMEDIVISSAENLLQLRDINLARSEEEACREMVYRIPESPALKDLDRNAALNYAESVDHTEPSDEAGAYKTRILLPNGLTSFNGPSFSGDR